MEFLGTLWRGDAGLKRTYWLYGALGSLIFFVVPGSALTAMNLLGPKGSVWGYFLLTYLVGLTPAYAVFISISIWRSADKYDGNPLWRILAKVAVLLGVVEAGLFISGLVGI
ncbi:MAG: hypothetical protein HQ512_14335 [Rhodospirillales bacterium]|nr:hypothetical protein [Rhodospirillales bacterium]